LQFYENALANLLLININGCIQWWAVFARPPGFDVPPWGIAAAHGTQTSRVVELLERSFVHGADVKQFWLMTLTQIVPDSMDSRYYAVLKQNTALEEALQSTLYDFEAQDIADEIVDSSSTNAVNFSSARAAKRFP
jgi:hypothetical protein